MTEPLRIGMLEAARITRAAPSRHPTPDRRPLIAVPTPDPRRAIERVAGNLQRA
jgi:hypothetical protein